MKRIWYCSMALLTAGLTAALAVFYGTGAGAALSVAITWALPLYHGHAAVGRAVHTRHLPQQNGGDRALVSRKTL